MCDDECYGVFDFCIFLCLFLRFDDVLGDIVCGFWLISWFICLCVVYLGVFGVEICLLVDVVIVLCKWWIVCYCVGRYNCGFGMCVFEKMVFGR